MAVITPFITKNQVLGAKIETTTGTAIALSGSDGAFNVEDFTFDEDIPENKREGQGSLSRPASVPGARAARIKFKINGIYGKGATGLPDWMTTFLPACGMLVSSGTYSPITPGTVTLTMGIYEGGLIRKIVGAMGNVGFSATAGNPVVADFDFLGALELEADAAQIAPTFPTVIPPRWAGTTNTIGGTSFYWSKFELTMGNVLKLRENPTASGYLACAIVDRDGQLTVDPEMTLVATKNWQSELLASTQSAASIVAGTAANNIFTWAAPKAQPVIKARGDRGGLKTNELTFRLGRSGATAYDDEWSLTAA